jgi:hypothetical protein
MRRFSLRSFFLFLFVACLTPKEPCDGVMIWVAEEEPVP